MPRQSQQDKIEGGAWVLEYLTRENPTQERNAARRVLNEVVRAWPGGAERLWWKWFSEGASSLGMRSKVLDASVDEIMQLADDGARLVLYSGEPGVEWFAVFGKSRSRFSAADAGMALENRTLSRRALRRRLVRIGNDGELRCVVMQPEPAATGEQRAVGIKPFNRLRWLLQPEWSDIWIVVVFAFVVGLLMLASPVAVEALVNTVAFGRFLQPVIVLALVLLAFLGIQSAIRGLQTYVVEIIQRRLFARVAADLAYRLPRTEAEGMDGKHMPELVNRFFDVVTVQKVSAQLLLDGIGLALSTIVGMAVLGFYHPWLLGFDILLLAFIAFIIFVLGRGAIASAVKESKNKYYMAAWLEDIARCPATFRSAGGAEFAMERADRLIHEYLTARRSHFVIVMRQVIFALSFQAVASTVLLGLGGWLVISGELTLGQLVAAELIVTVIVGAFAKVGKHIESFYDLLASVDKLGVLLDLPVERQDGMLGLESDQPIAVELHAVSYQWPSRREGLSTTTKSIRAGSSLAIVGPSGSGKSTLADLLYGLRSPTAGHLTLDSFDPCDLRPDVLRERVALIRSGEIFAGTLEENVHLHREDVSTAEVRDALNDVGLGHVTLQLSEGVDAHLSSSGTPLTENQCRLLSVARGMVSVPGLLVIDGVLDSLGEDELATVLDALVHPDAPWTLIVMTTRRSIAERLDEQLELKSTTPSSLGARK